MTKRQVQYIAQNRNCSPKKRSRRLLVFSEEQVDELVLSVTPWSAVRRVTYFELFHIAFPNWNFSERVIKDALERQGYEWRMARFKPVLTEERNQARLDFAEWHCSWTLKHWSQVLWTDKMWVTGSFHSGIRIT